MIKINFLSEEGFSGTTAEPSGAGGPGLPPARQATIFITSMLVSLAVAGALYWFWNVQINRVNQELAAEQGEAARLSAIQAENQLYQERVNEAERRLDTVHNLQSKRVGPVALMNALGVMVNRTTGLYLLTANADGSRLVIQGLANSVEAIVNFIAVIRRSGTFADVQFHQFFQDDQEKRTSFKFNIDCVYQPPTAAPALHTGSGVVKAVAAAPAGNAPATVTR